MGTGESCMQVTGHSGVWLGDASLRELFNLNSHTGGGGCGPSRGATADIPGAPLNSVESQLQLVT